MTQQRLKALGYDPGPIDGIRGATTKEALRRFQTESGLQAAGALDQATAKRLGIALP
jgi:peptidoglycan hydrolase-like protein with peptidoglycan-binding domain